MPTARSRTPARLWWTLGVVAVSGGVVLWILLGGQGDPASVEGLAGTEEPVQFEVASGRCGFSEVFATSGETVVSENGQFCVVRLSVRNLEEPRFRVDPLCQYMIDRSGERHVPRLDTSELRELADLEESLGPLEFKRPSSLHYDVPGSVEMEAVEVHASCDSQGLRIAVPS